MEIPLGETRHVGFELRLRQVARADDRLAQFFAAKLHQSCARRSCLPNGGGGLCSDVLKSVRPEFLGHRATVTQIDPPGIQNLLEGAFYLPTYLARINSR